MTLEDEIAKLDLISSDAFEGGDANEFRQLAEWLRELKAYRVHMRAYRMDLNARFENAVKGDGYQNGIGTACDLFDSYLEEVNADEC